MGLSRLIILALTLGSLLQGWGFETHRRINRAAAGSVSGPFGDYIYSIQDSLAAHAPDPDIWRKSDPKEGYRHYIDIDLYDTYPFQRAQTDYQSAINRFGPESLKSWGIAPWHILSTADSLTQLLKDNQWEDSIILMAALGHYIADIHMPLHTVENYNGQLTGNKGVHYRWESQMVDQYIDAIQVRHPVSVYSEILDEMFLLILESYKVHERLLTADTKAREGLTPSQCDTIASYEDGSFIPRYIKMLYTSSGDVAHDRLNLAATRVASVWLTCWIRAGMPTPPTHSP